jgi:branched-chain amino acid transport system ATP-binding protein
VTQYVLEADRLSVAFGGLQALSDVSCHLANGEILGIIGPNGAGKTTFLNAISGFVRTAPGARLEIFGKDASQLRSFSRSRLGLGRTFQSLELSPRDTVLDNVLAGAAMRYRTSGVWDFLGGIASRAQDRELTQEALEHLAFLEIDGWRHAAVGSVPYAVKKRLQICRALMAKPRILMLDEPASGMSPSEKERLSHALLALHAHTGLSLLVIEHDVGFLTGMCQRLIALNFGKILTDGPCATVIRDPRVIEAYLGQDDDSAAA